MTNIQSKTANIIGGKTARACDSCLRKRARWFCAADDAFLCQTCDTSVHSANQLASRHERTRLDTASWKTNTSWHHGFTKKPRTPRSKRSHQHAKDDDEHKKRMSFVALVPEISTNEDENEAELQELLLYRVPVLDPFATQICHGEVPFEMDDIIKDVDFDAYSIDHDPGMENPEFIISTDDIELEELNSLLGNEIEMDSCGIQNQELEGTVMDTASESFNWDFDYSKSPIDGEDEDLRIMSSCFPDSNFEMREKEKKRINLKINYEAVISAWDLQGSPWINGIKPHFDPADYWTDLMETGSGIGEINGEYVGRSGHGGSWKKEREARVLRYKEKRRKRLFAKKIRYEVRKLNAEKRPRLKGRFVKKT